MNGVSHMLVFVVAGGVLTAISFLWGITSFDSTAADYNTFAAMLKTIGGTAMNLMVPVLAAYIAESIGKRPALVPGFVAGMIAIQGLPVNPATGLIDAGGSGVGFGFLGGIVGGFLAGYVILLLEKVFAKLPANLNGLKAIFLYPLFSTLIVGLVMLGISGPMVTINNAMMDFLRSLQHAGAIPLGIAIGCMCAVDMGGPVNKAAYVTGTMLLGAGLEAGVGTAEYADGTAFMAAVSAACIVPPLVTSFAVIAGKKYFSQEDHDAGIVNIILGCTHITEGRHSVHDQEHLAGHAHHDALRGDCFRAYPVLGRSRARSAWRLLGPARGRWRPAVGPRHPRRHGRGRHPAHRVKKAEWTKAQREATAEVAVNDAPVPVDATAEAAEAPAEVPVDADDSEAL